MPKVAVTVAAAGHLQDILSEHAADREMALRLVPKIGGAFALVLDQPADGDESIEADGKTVLVIAPQVADLLDGSRIDVQETDEGPKLSISP